VTGFYILGALLLILIIVVVLAGLRGGGPVGAGEEPDGPAERQRHALAQLAELEFEYQTGKIGEEEYEEIKPRLARAALAARAEIEGVPESEPRAADATAD
jgi:uncharacterized membrane protein